MARYENMFKHLADKIEGAFVPFVTLGDPNIELSEKIIESLIAGGADALELGMPFSDPVADGPVIQAANFRALASNVTIAACFELLSRIRARHPNLPIGLLVYCNLVHANSVEAFYKRCNEAGVDSVLIADVPTREAIKFRASAQKENIQSVYICPPDASPELRKTVAQMSEGYIYLLSRAGVTGAGDSLQTPATEAIDELQQANGAPALLGFGISQPAHVRAAIQSGAKGAISGSAVVKIIEKNLGDEHSTLEELKTFVHQMKDATQGA